MEPPTLPDCCCCSVMQPLVTGVTLRAMHFLDYDNFKACIRRWRWPLLLWSTPFITAVPFGMHFHRHFILELPSGGANHTYGGLFFEAFRSHTELTTLGAAAMYNTCTYDIRPIIGHGIQNSHANCLET